MAIKIKLEDAEWTEYVPEWNGNRECSKKEQICAKIKYISQEDQDKITDSLIGQQRDGFRAKAPVKWSQSHHEMVNSHIKEIKNVYVVDKEGKEKEIKTMSELYKIPMLKGLYSEFADSLDATNRLEEHEIKN